MKKILPAILFLTAACSAFAVAEVPAPGMDDVNPYITPRIQVNDHVTVVINERITFTNDTTVTTEKTMDLGVSLSALLGKTNTLKEANPLITGTASRTHDGNGDLEHNERFTSRVATRVMEVMPNGTLLIEARKSITMGEEVTTIVLSGYVDPRYVGADNTISSDRVADAQISYKGTGVVSDASKRTLLQRLFDWVNIF